MSEPVETGLSVADKQPGELLEFRRAFMSMEPPQMQAALAQYTDRRDTLRKWLVSMMVEGIHYGWAPGTAPKWRDANGKPAGEANATHVAAWNAKKSCETLTPLTEYRPKRSLLAAGADLVCDLMWVRDEYAADMETWAQLGSVSGHIVRKCKLYSRSTGEFLGEGTGARLLGQKGGDLNNSTKMADKSAKVAAVLNTWGLRELFTQDEPPEGPQAREKPDAKPDAPTAAPRGERIAKGDLTPLYNRWKKAANPDDCGVDAWNAYVKRATGREFHAGDLANWTRKDLELIAVELSERGA